MKLERILLGIIKQKILLIFSEEIGRVHIIIDVNIIKTRGRNQIITPFPNIKGIDAKIPKNAPLEFIKLIAKINKTDKKRLLKI